MKKIYFITIISLILNLISCKEEPIGQISTDNIPPQPISNVQVESMPGGAKISYDLPRETDLSYVKGEYLFQGKTRIVRASVYNNFMVVEGLGSIDPVEIILYTVDHSENVSTPVKASFTPSTPPIEEVFSSLELREDFGGVNASWLNETGTEIGITLYVSNDNGIMEEGETYYTNFKEGDYSFRGYDTAERIYALTVTDKWGNVSDTLKGNYSPYFEKLLDKSKHKRELLPVDNNTEHNSSWAFSKMFDGITGNQGWHTKENDPNQQLPIYFTIDLGSKAKLSRFKLWHRFVASQYYSHHNVKTFEVWGTNEYKKGMFEDYWNETWKNDWECLGDYRVMKPSGDDLPMSEEDKVFAEAGFEFLVPVDKIEVRYLRFAVKSTWAGSKALHISELEFYGDDGSDNLKKD